MGQAEIGARLRAARVARSWTLEDVAIGLHQLEAELGDAESAADANQLSKWERGVRTPGRYYQPRLCVLFDAMPADLGFSSSPRLMRDIGDVRRRRAGAVPVAEAEDRLGAALRHLWPVDGPLLEELERRGKELIRRSDIEPPTSIIPDMREFRDAIMALLSRSQPEPMIGRLLVLASEASRSIAWLSDHTRHWQETYTNYALAESLAREGHSGNQLAQVLINRSELYAHRSALPEHVREAAALAEDAALVIGADALAGLKGWVLGRRAIFAAEEGDEATAFRRLEEAYRLAAQAPHEMNLFSDYDSAWLDSYRAAVVLKLRPGEAIVLFEEVLSATDPALTWERMSALSQLAQAHAARGDVDHAAALLKDSVGLARHTGDERGFELARQYRDRHLARWRSEPAVRRLDEAIREARRTA